jgi:hypothetical protein
MRHPLKGPKIYTTDSEEDEVLALGEMATYIEDPDDHSNRPRDAFNGAWLLGEEVETLMRRAFTTGLHSPQARPLAAEWGDALVRMSDQIVPCSNAACTGKAFVLLKDRPAVCPWCGTKIPRPAKVPVLRLYYGVGQVGHFQPDKARIVGWQARTLHRWHTQTDISERAAKPEERTPVAEIQYQQGEWKLINTALEGLRVTLNGSIEPVEIGQPTALQHEQRILFGQGNSAKLAVVTMQDL